MNMPPVSIVVLNWNGRDDTLACLASVERLAYPNLKVHVVDNGSSDGSVHAILAQFPKVDVIQTGSNLGYAGGNNAGMRRALETGAMYVLLLNNDTVVDPGLLRAFVSAAQREPQAAAFSAKIFFYDEPDRIWYAGARWDGKASCFFQVGEGERDDQERFATISETAYACGCAFFVSAKRLREIGLLDEDFFLYFEETDWCYRARRRGYPSVFVPEAKLWHKVSVSFGGERSPLALYFLTRNRLLWARRHAELGTRVRLYARTVGMLARRFLSPLADPRGASSPRERWWALRSAFRDARNRACLLGAKDFVFGRLGDCPQSVRDLSKRWSTARLAAEHARA